MRIQTILTGTALVLLLGLLGTAVTAPRGQTPQTPTQVPVTAKTQPLSARACQQGFSPHTLPHTALGRTQPIKGYDGNGAGVALGDLDNDGLIDIVLATQVGSSSIFWNQGGLKFRRTLLATHNARAVAVVDVDGDGWLDISFTHGVGTPSYWRNQQGQGFVPGDLPGLRYPAFTFLWDDLEGKGQLDLFTASYDGILEAENRDGFLFGDGAGVVLYRPGSRGYEAERLSNKAQALGLASFDTNGDGKRDLIVGNDFELPDMVWQQTPSGWELAHPFPRFSKHTMGFSSADINNDGSPELFSTDMKPDFRDLKTLATWIPLMEKVYKKAIRSAPQKSENMLQMKTGKGYRNVAYGLGLDATGWSWSAKFGDLDNDGFEDLYVVNGMMDIEQFPYLPGGELVEQNQVFRNLSGRRFERKPDWNLGSTGSGRGLSMADLDNDGDLDIVVSNLGSPAQVFENQLCGGQAIEAELRWEGTQNTRAIGAQVLLHTSKGQQWRQVTATSGFISGDAPRVHFGLGKNETIDSLQIIWPDQKRSTISNPQPQTLLILTRQEDKP